MSTPNRAPTLQLWGMVGAILQENDRVAKLTPTQRLRQIRDLIENARQRDDVRATEVSPAFWPDGLQDEEAERIERLAKGGR